jgi:hypothetical protein
MTQGIGESTAEAELAALAPWPNARSASPAPKR